MIETLPTNAQIEYAENLLEKLGYEKSDVFEMRNKEFDALTRQEMSYLIRDLKREWGG
jgi:hypothetical protein